MNEALIRGFFSTLAILRDYLPQIVVAGGWAPFLYYRYYVGDKTRASVLTGDIDLMVRQHVPTVGSRTIGRLLTDAGLTAVFKTNDTPPIVHYEGTVEDVPVEVEFLTDQTGFRSDVVLEVQKGLHAEAFSPRVDHCGKHLQRWQVGFLPAGQWLGRFWVFVKGAQARYAQRRITLTSLWFVRCARGLLGQVVVRPHAAHFTDSLHWPGCRPGKTV